jgi:hypothetical protein
MKLIVKRLHLFAASTLVAMLWFGYASSVQAQLTTRYRGIAGSAAAPSITSSFISHANGASFDDHVYTNVAIGFPFYFNGAYYTSLNISANGWVSFGSGMPTSASKFTYGLNANGGSGVIAALSQDWAGWDSASVSSGNATTAGVRQFVVQWNRLRFPNTAITFNAEMAVRLVLQENGGIYIHLSGIRFLSSTPNAFQTQIGLRGATSSDIFCYTNNNGPWSGAILQNASMPFGTVGQGQGTMGADNPQGRMFGFELVSAPPPLVMLPTVDSFTPASGSIGSTLAIMGTNFTSASAVSFGGVAATSFSVVSATQIIATVPSGAMTGLISVTTPSGTATSKSSFTVTVTPPPVPTITSFTPASGMVGTTVTITGTNFTGATAVRFGTVNAVFTVNSPTQITATVPSGAVTAPIIIVGLGGLFASATSFTIVAPPALPTITSFSPVSGTVGARIRITGANLGGVRAAYFGGVRVTEPIQVINDVQIELVVPASAVTGVIAVTADAGTVHSSSAFTVESATLTIPILMPSNVTFTAATRIPLALFAWTPVSGATGYRLEIASDAAFTNLFGSAVASYPVVVSSSPSTAIVMRDPGESPYIVYWRVRAELGAVAGRWSLVGTCTMNPQRRIRVSPFSQAQGSTITTTIRGTMTNLSRVTSVTLRRGDVVIVGTVIGTVSPTTMQVSFAVPNSTPVGDYTLTVNDPSGDVTALYSIAGAVDGLEASVSNGFNPRVHGFAFCNCYGQIWPPVRPIDYTDARFPDLLRDSARTGAITSEKWSSFEDDITRRSIFLRDPRLTMNDGLNYTGTLRDVPFMLTQSWVLGASGTGRALWGGSCHGMSLVALLNYAGYPAYQFSLPPFTVSGANLRNESLQKLINRQHHPQYADPATNSPNEVVQLLRRTLSNSDRTQQRVMYVFDGAHVVVPYRLAAVRNASGMITDLISIYDPNAPGSNDLIVSVDRNTNTASYAGWTGALPNSLQLGLPATEYPKFTRPFSDILATSKFEHGLMANTDTATLRREITFPWFVSGNGYTTPRVTLRSQWGQSISTSGPIPSPTWSTVQPIRETGGLAPNFFDVIRGFSTPANSEATVLSAEYQPVATAQALLSQQTQSLFVSQPDFSALVAWKVQNAGILPFLITTNTVAKTVKFVASNSTTALDISLSYPVDDKKLTSPWVATRIWNASTASGDSLQLQLDVPNRRVIMYNYAGNRSYNIDLEFGSQRRKFVAIPIATEETHIYSLDDWTQLAITNLALTSRTLTDIGAVVERPVNLRPFITTSIPAQFEALNVNFYPNPAQNLISIEASIKAAGRVGVRLSNALGMTLVERTEQVPAGVYRTSLDVSSLAAGVYFVRVESGGQAWVEKVVKN